MPEISIKLDPSSAKLYKYCCSEHRSRENHSCYSPNHPHLPESCQHEPVVHTCSEKRSGSIIQPGTPQFSCSVVDPVLLPWKLILGVEVMIAHRRIDFSI